MLSRSRVGLGLTILGAIVTASVAWFTLVEDFTLLEALYQTVLTISTVGFREVHPLEGRSQFFTIVVILFGVGAMLYTVTALFEVVVENQLGRIGRRRMERQIASLSGHAVVCGYGRVGRIVAELLEAPVRVVVVDTDIERARTAAAAGFAVVEGDATDDDVLHRAGLERARILVSALPSDADNVYVVLSARATSADLHIVARARSEESEPKLVRAGADRVINPQEIGARRIAAFALQPTVSDFLDVVMHGAGEVEYRLEEITIPDAAPVAGLSIREAHIRDHTGALLLALRGGDRRFVTNPEPEHRLEPGMTVVAIGTDEQLERLHQFVRDGRGDREPARES